MRSDNRLLPMTVSIIIPNYNKGGLVRQSIESLLRQTYRNWEAVVVDDASMDDSWKIIGEYAAKDSRIRAVRNEENRGGCYSRNRGVRMATGKYLIFLDSDDWLADDCLEMRVREFEKEENRHIDMMIFEMATSCAGNIERNWNQGDRSRVLISFLRHEIVWQTMMPIWRREAFERLGGFDESFPRLQDVELHTRALLRGATYRFAERKAPDCFYVVDDSRMTMNHDVMARRFSRAILQYVEKMAGLVSTTGERKALAESLMAAIRGIGDSYQAGKIDKNLRDVLYGDILGSIGASNWVRLYARLYSLGMNKQHGFNFLYRKIYRRFNG